MKKIIILLYFLTIGITSFAHIIPEGTYKCLTYNSYTKQGAKYKTDKVQTNTTLIVEGDNIYIGADKVVQAIISIDSDTEKAIEGFVTYKAYDLKSGELIEVQYGIKPTKDQVLHFIFKIIYPGSTEIFDTKKQSVMKKTIILILIQFIAIASFAFPKLGKYETVKYNCFLGQDSFYDDHASPTTCYITIEANKITITSNNGVVCLEASIDKTSKKVENGIEVYKAKDLKRKTDILLDFSTNTKDGLETIIVGVKYTVSSELFQAYKVS